MPSRSLLNLTARAEERQFHQEGRGFLSLLITDVPLLDKILRASTSADLPGFQLLPRRRFIFAPLPA